MARRRGRGPISTASAPPPTESLLAAHPCPPSIAATGSSTVAAIRNPALHRAASLDIALACWPPSTAHSPFVSKNVRARLQRGASYSRPTSPSPSKSETWHRWQCELTRTLHRGRPRPSPRCTQKLTLRHSASRRHTQLAYSRMRAAGHAPPRSGLCWGSRSALRSSNSLRRRLSPLRESARCGLSKSPPSGALRVNLVRARHPHAR